MRTIDPNKESTQGIDGLLLEGEDKQGIRMFANIPVAIKHGLGKKQRGWLVTDLSGNAIIFRKREFNAEVLVLESTANTSIKLWVY